MPIYAQLNVVVMCENVLSAFKIGKCKYGANFSRKTIKIINVSTLRLIGGIKGNNMQISGAFH